MELGKRSFPRKPAFARSFTTNFLLYGAFVNALKLLPLIYKPVILSLSLLPGYAVIWTHTPRLF